MSNLNIYMFDNKTGRDIPEKIDIYPVNLLLGNSINEIHKYIQNCQLFCVFTHITDADIIVQNQYAAELLQSILSFGNYNYKIVLKDSNIWYCQRAENNIIFSDTVTLSASELATVLRLYLNDFRKKQPEIKKIYRVINVRTKRIISRTPNWYDAKNICDKNPGTIIIDNNNSIMYQSVYGKVKIPTKLASQSNKYLFQINIP